jgi:NitT/TauT family transport system substrate-binding protein
MTYSGQERKEVHMTLPGLRAIVAIAAILAVAVSLHAEPVRLGTWKTAQTIQPFYYQRFLPESTGIRVFAFTNPADQKVALLAGSLDMCGTTLAHAIHSAALGQPVVVVAALCNKCSALVVRHRDPIRRVADLGGKRIGYVPGTMHEILLRETLVQNGLSPDRDVRLTRVDFFDMGMALARGGIDAFLSGEPFPSLAVSDGYGRILSYPYFGETIGTINAGMLVTRETIEANRKQVFSLVLAHAKATEYLRRHRDEWLRDAAAFGTSLSVLQEAAPNMELAWWMDADFVRKVAHLGRRMQALGVIERQPDYERLIDLSFVARAKEVLETGQGREPIAD